MMVMLGVSVPTFRLTFEDVSVADSLDRTSGSGRRRSSKRPGPARRTALLRAAFRNGAAAGCPSPSDGRLGETPRQLMPGGVAPGVQEPCGKPLLTKRGTGASALVERLATWGPSSSVMVMPERLALDGLSISRLKVRFSAEFGSSSMISQVAVPALPVSTMG